MTVTPASNGRHTVPPTPFEDALNKTGNGVYNVLLSCTCALILLAVGVDLFGLSLVVQAACELDITVSQKGILTSVPFIGILVVSYPWGYIADTRGRRYTLVLSMGASFVLSCLSSLSPNWIYLAVLKFFAVCFSCASHSATYTLVGESCIRRVRSKYMLMMTGLLLLSSAVGALLAYPTLKLDFAIQLPWPDIVFRPWRLLLIVFALPCGIGAVAIYFFHESPKFLVNCGRIDEAVHVLNRINAINNYRSKKKNLNIHSLTLDEESSKKGQSILRSIYEQSAPLFRPPYLWRTMQLYYLIAVVFVTNNTIIMWLPHVLDVVRIAIQSGNDERSNVCSLITDHHNTSEVTDTFNNITSTPDTNRKLINPTSCNGTVEDNIILTVIVSQCVFTFLNFVISNLPNRRKVIVIAVLCLSGISGICQNLIPDQIISVSFFVMLSCTCLAMGSLASYFVDLYPTSYRGMVACLSIMVGRSSSFIGINIVGNLLFQHCELIMYAWSFMIFSAVVAAAFLPPDKIQK